MLSTKSSRKNLTIRMTTDLKQRLKIQAVLEQRDLSDLIEDGMRAYLERQQVPQAIPVLS